MSGFATRRKAPQSFNIDIDIDIDTDIDNNFHRFNKFSRSDS